MAKRCKEGKIDNVGGGGDLLKQCLSEMGFNAKVAYLVSARSKYSSFILTGKKKELKRRNAELGLLRKMRGTHDM